jgi:outer membrane protein assembly factor BamA
MVDLLNIPFTHFYRRLPKLWMIRHLAVIASALLFVFQSCTIIRKKPEGKPFIYKNSIEVKGGKFTKLEKANILQRLRNQIEDSATNKVKDFIFIIHTIKKPPAFDTAYAGQSARNMKASMFHIGYYNAQVNYRADTNRRNMVRVKYTVETGKPTLVSSLEYNIRKPDLQQLALNSSAESRIKINSPVSKAGVLGEIDRLVDTFRNNGYYKFTSAELKMRGDTSIESLTNVSDDPFEQLRLLAEAQQKKDSPQIKLALALNPPADTSILQPYRINKIYLLTDYQAGDILSDTNSIKQRATRRFIIREREKFIRTGFLNRTISLRSGDLIRQRDNAQTLNAIAQTGVWRNVNMQVIESKDSIRTADIILEMTPNYKFNFQAALEASYAASRNILSGNLFGVSLNLSLLNRNFKKEGIRMMHTIRAGIELNNRSRGSNISTINSNEFSYSNSISIPQLIWPFNRIKLLSKNTRSAETFINSSLAYNNRLNLFNLQSLNSNLGMSFFNRKGQKFYWKPLNVEFSYLFNQSDSFKTIINENPFLRYSYNTAFALGMGAGYSSTKIHTNKFNTITREKSFKLNLEESGITWGLIPAFRRYKRNFVKSDIEFKYSVNYPKTTLVLRLFTGVGIPLLGSDTNRTLPFFKQYFGGGSNSMRGWPLRGIGPGGKALTPFSSAKTIFNDRTGDMQFEGNIEFRYNIAPIIPNTLLMRGAVFVDFGNIWNFRNTNANGISDSSRFELKNFYKQLGLSAGTGIRFDFSNLILRLDLGFRFKRPEMYYKNAGWKAPDIGFDDFFKKIFTRGSNDEYRKWRYENFNFSVGISYPF